MRILVVGAGALGGYFGGRLLAAGQDVTFLLRPRRVAQLAKTGLVIKSPKGDLALPAPPSVQADAVGGPYDVVVVGCKAYDLAETMESFAPAVGPETAILPLLNGMRHLDDLAQRFGAARVLGGLCMISASLDAEGRVLHHNDMHGLTYGELGGEHSARVQSLEQALAGANFDARASDNILQDMWEKWMFIASAASMTCLMRATVGDIVESGGTDISDAVVDECAAILAHNGFAPRAESLARAHAMLAVKGSPVTASMFKDIDRGAPIEADHIVGDLLRRGEDGGRRVTPLRIAYAHLRAYEARRARESISS